MNDTNGNASYIIAGVWNNQPMESDTVNQVKSVYPLNDFVQRITKNAEEGKLIVTNKNKVEQMLATIGVQPSEVSHIINLAKDSLPQKETNVNRKATRQGGTIKKYPTKDDFVLFGYFLLCPTNLFVVKIMRKIRTASKIRSFCQAFLEKRQYLFVTLRFKSFKDSYKVVDG